MLSFDPGSLAPDARHFIGRAHVVGAALALADHPTYGLRAGVYTRAVSRALWEMKRLEAGTVWINRYGRSRDQILPNGGYKASGVGKDLGREAYQADRRSTSVLIDIQGEVA
jgi:aldehyde dehydrogenase (NAD+)